MTGFPAQEFNNKNHSNSDLIGAFWKYILKFAAFLVLWAEMCWVNQRRIIILLKLNINHILLKIKVQVKPSFDFPIFRSLLKTKKNNRTALN